VRVIVKCVKVMPHGVCAWLVQRAGTWVLYIAEELLTRLHGAIPGVETLAIAPRWHIAL
jgi:hypothetical protein